MTVFCQCAGGPALQRVVEVRNGGRAFVALQQRSVSLSLVNQSALTKDQAIAARKEDRSLKLIPDNQIQFLLDALAAKKFFDLSSQFRDEEARSFLIVHIDGKQHILSGKANRGDHAYMKMYADCVSIFTTIYNANDSFAGSKMGARDLKRAGDSTNQESYEIRKRKTGKGNTP